MDTQIPSPIEDVSSARQTIYLGLASFTIMIWDHVDTFSTEVEFIWKDKKRGLIIYLFLLNRYLTPLGFIHISPPLGLLRCNRFIRYEGSMTMIGIEIVAIMMLLRVHALYHKQRWVVGVVSILLLSQVGVNSWLLTRGEAVVHNLQSHVHSCTMIFDPDLSAAAATSAWLPLLYDTVVLGLTVYRTYPALHRKDVTFITKRIFEDGLIYYICICAVTLVLTVMIIAAPPGLKNITAQLELLLTVTMMSRITLNLKKSAHKLDVIMLNGKRSQVIRLPNV